MLNNGSYLGAIYTGRDFADGFNRVLGSDGRLRLSNYGTLEFHAFRSFTKDIPDAGMQTVPDPDTRSGNALGLLFNYRSRRLNFESGVNYVSQYFHTDVGYLTRTGAMTIPTALNYTFYPKSDLLQSISPFYRGRHTLDTDSKMVESFNVVGLELKMTRQTEVRIDAAVADEVFAGKRFNRNRYGLSAKSQLFKQLALSVSFKKGNYVYYDYDAPFQAKGKEMTLGLVFQPLDKLSTALDLTYADLFDSSETNAAKGNKLYKYTILRNRTTVQFNKYLFIRAVVEYNSYWKRLNTDLLASFTYIPGTVLYIGYGSMYEKLRWDYRGYVPQEDFMQTQKRFFFKASYLFRF